MISMTKMEVIEEPKKRFKVKYQKEPVITDNLINQPEQETELSPEDYEEAINQYKQQKAEKDREMAQKREIAQKELEMAHKAKFQGYIFQPEQETYFNQEDYALKKEFLKTLKIFAYLFAIFMAFEIAYRIVMLIIGRA